MSVASAAPVRLLLSATASQALHPALVDAFAARPWQLLVADTLPPGRPCEADIAFVSRDVTGCSTKHELEAHTAHFHDLLRGAPGLQWVQAHSAGADRPVYLDLMARCVRVTTGSGTGAPVVAQTAVSGLLALARGLPAHGRAQREHCWPARGAPPRDVAGQLAVIVGWGPIGRQIARVLRSLDMRIAVVRHGTEPAGEGLETVSFDALHGLLQRTDWLVLACPLTERTHRLVDARALALLPAHAHLVNVARGEVVHEAALVEALQAGRLAGAFLDVFEHEPLPAASPLWDLDNVIVTPHCASYADSHEPRVTAMFLDNLRRWLDGRALVNQAQG
jgi:phosphoglycerate dehydrogenase-like enzyme